MSAMPLAILQTGLVTSVGLSAPAACAAIRAGLTNPTETRYISPTGGWIMAHQVSLDEAWRGRQKLVRMASFAIEEALEKLPREEWGRLPLLLCIAEHARPGRTEGLDDRLLAEIEHDLGVRFAEQSAVFPHGRVSVAVALMQARKLVERGSVPYVLIAATDSLVSWPTLYAYQSRDRPLTTENSDGFIAGEGAGAVLVGRPDQSSGLLCRGIGFATEASHVDSESPLRADGLVQAISNAVTDAGCAFHDLDFRIADLSGEQYYFKEAALAMSRLLRVRKPEFDIWHPADCIGEAGAVAGAACIAVAAAAFRKGYSPGPRVLLHASSDAGERTAAVLHFGAD